MNNTLPTLDPLLHQPARTQLIAFLSGRGEATFSELKRALGATDGNLGAHLNKLLDAGYVGAREEMGGNRPQTVFFLTATGRAALTEYVSRLSTLISLGTDNTPGAVLSTAASPLPKCS